MGKRALKAGMPRVLPNHNGTQGRRLRYAYVDLLGQVKEPGGVARRVALLGAEAWINYEDLGLELAQASRKKKSAQEISRMRRRRQAAAGHFLAALRTLEFLTNRNGHDPQVEDLMKLPDLGGHE